MTLNELRRDQTSNIRVQKTIYDILRCVVFLLRTVLKSLHIIGRGALMYVAVLCNVGSNALNKSDLYWNSDATMAHASIIISQLQRLPPCLIPRFSKL